MDVIIIVFITTLYFFILNVDIVALNKVRKISMVKFYTLVIQRKLFCLTINFLFILTSGRLDRITIQPGRTMKIIATVLGPLKKYVGEIHDLQITRIFVMNYHTLGKEVLVSQMDDCKECPVQPQVLRNIFINQFSMKKCQIRRICENDCIGFDVTNDGRETMVLEKNSQTVANLSVWATVRMEEDTGSARIS